MDIGHHQQNPHLRIVRFNSVAQVEAAVEAFFPGELAFVLYGDSPLGDIDRVMEITHVGHRGFTLLNPMTLESKYKMRIAVGRGADSMIDYYTRGLRAQIADVNWMIEIMHRRLQLPNAAIPFAGPAMDFRAMHLHHGLLPVTVFPPTAPFDLHTNPAQSALDPPSNARQGQERELDIKSTHAFWRYNLRMLQAARRVLIECKSNMIDELRAEEAEQMNQNTDIGIGFADPRFLYRRNQDPPYPEDLPEVAEDPNVP